MPRHGSPRRGPCVAFHFVITGFRRSKRGSRMTRLIERSASPSRIADFVRGPGLTATLRGRLGFIAATCLLTALMCLVKGSHAAEPGRARAVSGQNAGAKVAGKSARQLYSAGCELCCQERYAAALATFESAVAAEGDLSPSERNRLEDYLKRARMKSIVPVA